MVKEEKKSQITLYTVSGWFFGIVFFLVALSFLIIGKSISGLLALGAGLVVFPPFFNSNLNYLKRFNFSRGVRVLLVVILLVLSGAFYGSTGGNYYKDSPSPQSSILITSPTSSLLIGPEDLSTEWIISNSTSEVGTSAVNSTGFIEGSKARVHKGSSYNQDIVGYYVYRFDSQAHAFDWFNQTVNELKSQRGYTEVDLRGSPYTCFGKKAEIESSLSSLEKLNAVCYYSNLAISLSVVSYTYNSESIAREMIGKLKTS